MGCLLTSKNVNYWDKYVIDVQASSWSYIESRNFAM